MNKIKKIKYNQSILIAFLELIVGVFLLISEIRDFIRLPKTTEMYKIYGGLAEVIELFKYKENTYSLLYLWTILLFAGGSYWINLKLHWTLNQIFLMTLFFGIILRPEFFLPFYFKTHYLILFLLVLFVWAEIKLYNKSHIKKIGIGNRVKIFSVILGIISITIYYLISII